MGSSTRPSKCYGRGLLVKPKATSLRLNLASVLREKELIDDAIAELHEAIKINGGDEATYLNLGEALKDKGDLDGAIAAYRAAIRINRKIAQPTTSWGLPSRGRGTWPEPSPATGRLSSSIRTTSPPSPTLWRGLSRSVRTACATASRRSSTRPSPAS